MFSVMDNSSCQRLDRVLMPLGTYFNSKSNLTNGQLRALLAVHPVAALMDASQKGFATYRSGIYSCPHKATKDDLGHAVEVVGYDEDGNYIVKNSDGKGWGNNGTGIIDKLHNCGIGLRVYYLTN